MSAATGVCVRPAEAQDAAAIHRVTVAAFSAEPGSERWRHWEQVAQGWQSFLVLERQGEVVGAARVGRDALRFGPAGVLLKGDVGHVSILPELQGHGLGTVLMRETVAYLRESGFALSRLGGLNAFYSRFGYVPFPRRYYEFPLELVRAGARKMPVETLLKPTPEEEATVRPYAPKADWPERCRLYDAFHAGRTGALVEGRPPRPQAGGPDTSGLRWVCTAGGAMHAYAFGSLTGTTAEIHDVAADPGHLSALAAVVRRVLYEAVRTGATQALGRLPFDHAVESTLTEGAVSYVLRELQTAPASNMLLLVSLRDFLEVAMPAWNARLSAFGTHPWSGVVELRVGGETARLAFARGAVEPADERDGPAARVAMPPRAFLLAALGHRDWHEVASQADGDVPVALAATLGILLRREPVASGPLG